MVPDFMISSRVRASLPVGTISMIAAVTAAAVFSILFSMNLSLLEFSSHKVGAFLNCTNPAFTLKNVKMFRRRRGVRVQGQGVFADALEDIDGPPPRRPPRCPARGDLLTAAEETTPLTTIRDDSTT
jgi:hypothetical protein